MRRPVFVRLFTATVGGLLLLAPGFIGLRLNQNFASQARELGVHQSGAIQDHRLGGGCGDSEGEDPFALDPGRRRGASVHQVDNEKLPPAIQVNASRNRVLMTRLGVGVQVYDHNGTNGMWVFREPQANLYDIETGVQHGIHFVGPFWTDTDGSRVKAKVSGEVEAPSGSERNIKWLRLEAVEKFGGANDVLSKVTFIQRILTHGGQAPVQREPVDGCDTVSVPYTALYVFWGPREQ